MERLKGMKSRNNWMLSIIGTFLCTVICLSHNGLLAAADEEEQGLMSLEYLDPFDLTVTQMTYTEQAGSSSLMLGLSSVEPAGASSSYSPPLKIWIPYRPTFRSPCVPSL
jgi:hypothetical protein